MRLSSAVQAALIMLVIGYLFKDTPAGTPASVWPYFLAGYALLAVVVPWTIGAVGGFLDDEFILVQSAVLGIFFALPMWVAAGWLDRSPYPLLATGCWALLALWPLHVLVSLIAAVRRKLRQKKSTSTDE